MALEFWLHEEIDKGHDVSGVLERILLESESLAFAGLLIDIGKKQIEFLAGPLRPLLACAALYELDLRTCVERQGTSVGLMAWGFQQSPELVAMARDWYRQPHRRHFLRDIAQRLLIAKPEVQEFYVGVRSAWREEMQGNDRHPLRYLVEQLNPENYFVERLDDQHVRISVRLPEDLQQQVAEGEKQRAEELLIMMTPVQCRMRLDKNDSVPAAELDQFWDNLQRLDALRGNLALDEYGMSDPVNGVMGAVTVLMVFHMDWLEAEPPRLAWCRAKLEEVCTNPPKRSLFDVETADGGSRWDAFAAEAGVVLLTIDTRDPLARHLVAGGVMGNRYATAGLTVNLRSLVAFKTRRRVPEARKSRCPVLGGKESSFLRRAEPSADR